MCLDHRAGDAQKGRSPHGAVVQLALEPPQAGLEDEGRQLGEPRGHEDVLHLAQQEARGALRRFQQDVAGEAVAHQHIDRAGKDLPPLDVAGKMQLAPGVGLAEQGIGLLAEGVALALLGAVVHQGHPGAVHAALGFLVQRAHEGKLEEIFRGAFGVGPAVQQKGPGAGLLGHHGPQSGPADAADALDRQGGPGEESSGGPGGDHGVGLALGQQPEAHSHAGILFLAEDGGGLILHLHHLAGVDQGDMLGLPPRENGLHPGPVPHQEDVAAIVLRGQDGPLDRGLRGVIAAHGVQDDLHASSPSLISPSIAPRTSRARWEMAV